VCPLLSPFSSAIDGQPPRGTAALRTAAPHRKHRDFNILYKFCYHPDDVNADESQPPTLSALLAEHPFPGDAIQTTVRAIWYAQELGHRQALDVARTLSMLGTDGKSMAAGQQTLRSERRGEWRLR
jgi:hypothetical protein